MENILYQNRLKAKECKKTCHANRNQKKSWNDYMNTRQNRLSELLLETKGLFYNDKSASPLQRYSS